MSEGQISYTETIVMFLTSTLVLFAGMSYGRTYSAWFEVAAILFAGLGIACVFFCYTVCLSKRKHFDRA
jgi:hypothetical protein